MSISWTLGRTLSVLVAAALYGGAGAAIAQAPPAGQAPQAEPQGGARDLLGRARSTNEGQMVEDLIRRLQGPGGDGAAPAQGQGVRTPSASPGAPPAANPSTGPAPVAAPSAPGTPETPAAGPAPRSATPSQGRRAPPAAAARMPEMPRGASPPATPPGGVAVAPPAGSSPFRSAPGQGDAPGAAPPSSRAVQPTAAPQPGVPTQQAQPRRLQRQVTPPAAGPGGPDPSAQPGTPAPTQQALPRRLQRQGTPPSAAPGGPDPSAQPVAAPGSREPLQAPIPDTIASPTATGAPPPSTAAAPPPGSDPAQPGQGQRRFAPGSRRASGQPPGPPPGADGPPQRVLRQVPITPAQIERMDALPNIDVEVLFFIDSAQLTNRAFATLAILGRALSDERLAGQTFLIAGHTDASGPPDYNLALSERRAQVVREFLVNNFQIAPERLLARGFGPTKLKVPQFPGSGLNRRVQVVNWTSEMDPNAATAPPQAEPPQAAPPPPPPPRRR